MQALSMKNVLRAALAVALTSAGLAAVTTAPASAVGVPCERTYTSGALGYPIPDTGSSTGSIINVPEDGLVVSDVDVTVNLHHPNVSDLSMTIVSGTDALAVRGTVSLADHRGGTGDNMLGTVFDDAAAGPIAAGAAPFSGRFRPESALATLNGAVGGLYHLVVTDTVSTGGPGTLDDWALTLRYASCDFDTDGVEDHADGCLAISAHTATGCPLTTGRVGASYRKGTFRGHTTSAVAACASGRNVTIWKVRPGADRKVGTATTRSDGSYRLVRAKHAGRYYATAPRVAVTDVAECPAVQSVRFRIR